MLILFIVGLILQHASCQQAVLFKTAKIVDEGANPDVFEISLTLGGAFPVWQNATLKESIQDLLVSEVNSIGTEEQTADALSISFSSFPGQGASIANYTATLKNNGDGVSDTLTVNSVLTYFLVNQLQANVTEASVCLNKTLATKRTEDNQLWYIAVVGIPCLLFGIFVSVFIWWLIHRMCATSFFARPQVGDQKSDKKMKLRPSDILEDRTVDFPQVMVTNDVTDARRYLELLEIRDVMSTENYILSERAALLKPFLEYILSKRNHEYESRQESREDTKIDIQKAVKTAANEQAISKRKAEEKNKRIEKELQAKHEEEIEKLKIEISRFSLEVQEEFLLVVKEKHEIEMKEEKYLSLLRHKEDALSNNNEAEARCNLLSTKLEAVFAREESNFPTTDRDVYSLLLTSENKLMGEECARLEILKHSRIQGITKSMAFESTSRKRWNRFRQQLIEVVKTISRDLEIPSEVRKHITNHIKEEMVKAKIHFDHEKEKQQKEFLLTCNNEKSKYDRTFKSIPTKGIGEDALTWMESNVQRMQYIVEKNALKQEEFDKFIMETWRQKIAHVVQSTDARMQQLMEETSLQLTQNGASKSSVKEHMDRRRDQQEDQSSEENEYMEPISENANKSRARDLIMQSHSSVLRNFMNSQIFSTEKNSENALMDLERSQLTHTKKSLQKVRDIIHGRTMALQSIRKAERQKPRKRALKSTTEESIRSKLENRRDKWKEVNNTSYSHNHGASTVEFGSDIHLAKENLISTISSVTVNQMQVKSKLDLLHLDLNGLERLVMTLLQSLIDQQRLSPVECRAVLQEHSKQSTDLQKLSSQRTKRRLEQVGRKRSHRTINSIGLEGDDRGELLGSQIRHHLKTSKNSVEKSLQKLHDDSDSEKARFEVLRQLHEQQAVELRELDLKLIQALVKVSQISSGEMKAVLTLLLHHRNLQEIITMVQFIYSDIREGGEVQTYLLPIVRNLVGQQKHRLAENLLRTDEDFGPVPIRTSNKLQRIKQPHHVTFMDEVPQIKRDRFSPLPDIRPDPLGRTSTPEPEFDDQMQRNSNAVYNNFNQSNKATRRRKKKSLKNLNRIKS